MNRSRPGFVTPMLCKEVSHLPAPDSWFYEIQQDGYRALAVKDRSDVSLFSRTGKPLDFPEAREAVRKLHARSAVIDCELVALDGEGKPCFEALATADCHCAIRLYAFDLLHVNGRDVMSEPIERRKERLCTMTLDSSVLFAQSLDCEPDMLVEHVKELSLEGVVAKRKGSTYEPGQRSGAWVKMPVNQEAEFFIGGYAPGNPIESVVVGYQSGRRLLFAADVQTGLNHELRRKLFAAAKGLERTECPFVNLPNKRHDKFGEGITAQDMKDLVWLEPRLTAHIGFREWTRSRRLRNPAILRLA